MPAVELEHAVAHRRGADVPGGLGVVEERRAAAPAVRVRSGGGPRRGTAGRARRGRRPGRGRPPSPRGRPTAPRRR